MRREGGELERARKRHREREGEGMRESARGGGGGKGARERGREGGSVSQGERDRERAIIGCVQVTVQEIRLRCCSPTCIVLINLCLRQSPVSYLDPHVINLRAAVDNRLEQEDLPLAPWY